MKIADLQEYLRSLRPFLAKTCGAARAQDFERMGAGLAPFQDLSVAEFADFLARADEYARTGIVPTKGGRGRAAPQPKKSEEDRVKEAVQLVCSLYEKALDPDFRYETVDQQLALLDKLTIAQLKNVGKELQITIARTKKAEIIAEIARYVKGRREFHDRSRMGQSNPVLLASEANPSSL